MNDWAPYSFSYSLEPAHCAMCSVKVELYCKRNIFKYSLCDTTKKRQSILLPLFEIRFICFYQGLMVWPGAP